MIPIRWNEYFERNKLNQLNFDGEDYSLTNEEIKRITKSIQSFQLGESSEGRILIGQAKKFCNSIGDFAFMKSIKHLIREENRHSAYLGKFMSIHKIPKISKGINDSVFRWLRKLWGIEMSSRVLVTAEIIALTYYDCLSDATESELLKKICNTMCKEEEMHIKFQMEHIYWMSFKNHALISSLYSIGHHILLILTTLPVWIEHRKVLEQKFNYISFVKRVKLDFKRFIIEGQIVAARRLVREGFLKAEVLCI